MAGYHFFALVILLPVVVDGKQQKSNEMVRARLSSDGTFLGVEDVKDPSEWKTINVFAGPSEALGKKGQMHSQVGQDWLVATLLGCKSGGWFVDLAANDAMVLSNTLMLERDFGWKGLCLEANMNYMYGLSHRQCTVVSGAVGANRDETVHFTMRGVLGGIVSSDSDNKNVGNGQEVDLRTVPLGDILAKMNAPTVIDYFSLDVEGAESLVMQGFPWEKYRFSVITVERPKPDLKKQLTDNGYQHLRANSGFDDETWISTSIPNFDDIMKSWGSQQSGASPTSCMIEKGYAMPSKVSQWHKDCDYLECDGKPMDGSPEYVKTHPMSAGLLQETLVRRENGDAGQHSVARSSTYASMSNLRVSDKPQVPPWGHTIEIPAGITHVSINVGPNTTPIDVDGKDDLLILVDPLTSVITSLNQHHAGPHVLVYQAAISNVTGTAVFHEYNKQGVSSSLSKPSATAGWNHGSTDDTVQVQTLKDLIDAIPSNLPINFLKTDMQGYDFTAIKSAGDALKRVKKIMSETYADGHPTYVNTVNEYNRDWVPYMKKMGYTMDSDKCVDSYVSGKFHEMDCHWKLSD